MTGLSGAFLQSTDTAEGRKTKKLSILSAVITLQLYGQNMSLQGTLLSRMSGFDQVVAQCVSH